MGDQSGSKELTEEVHRIWERNAPFWDKYMGDGNEFHRLLVAPAVERLLSVRPPLRVLEAACGSGIFSRKLADLGAKVVAFDFSSAFIERARERSVGYADRIEYHVIDGTDAARLRELGKMTFDAAVCNMALMDMADLEPLLTALGELLKPKGTFVFSIMHPCFNSIGTTHVAEEEDHDGKLVTSYSVRVREYNNIPPTLGQGIPNQPEPHYYFHRTLSGLFNSCFRAGFVLDGIEEPSFENEIQPNRPLSWMNYHQIPPVLAARMRLSN